MGSLYRITWLLTLILVVGTLASCNTQPPSQPPIVAIQPSTPPTTVQVGKTIPLAAQVTGAGKLTFKWTATGGSVTPDNQAAVTFQAPNAPGSYIVSVIVTGDGGTTTKNITIEVVPPPVTPTPTPPPTASSLPTHTWTPTLTTTPTATWTPPPSATWTPTTPPPPTPFEPMERPSAWTPTNDGPNGQSAIKIGVVPGKTNNAIEITFTLVSNGYVIITRDLNPKELLGTRGISFYYKGEGKPNTIELKLMLKYPGFNEDTTFGVLWNKATDTGGEWTLVEAPYSKIACLWPAGNCAAHGNNLDLANVRRMDFAISNKPDYGDVAGSGKVVIDDVRGIPPLD